MNPYLAIMSKGLKMHKNKIIAPIAIDFGAKKTGVYYAQYPQLTNINDIKKFGAIFGQELEYSKDNTPLLRKRTANRHTRRKYDRLKFAKRLTVLILKEYFHFPVENHTQAISFLLNRRGFSRIDGDFNREHFKEFPKKVFEELPEDVKSFFVQENLNQSEENIDIFQSFENLINDPESKNLEKIYNELHKTNKEIKKETVYFEYVKKIKESARNRIEGFILSEEKRHKYKLSKTNKWIIEKLIKNGATSLIQLCQNSSINLLEHLNKINTNSSNLKQLAELSIDQEQKNTKNSIWNFQIEKFDLSKEENKDSFNSDSNNYLKTHLHHFSYVIYKIHEEKQSGARHRSKFFEEIKKLLNSQNFEQRKSQNCFKHRYFEKFLKEIDKHPNLNRDKIYKLICHISNFELKPLRSYFNDKNYKNRNDKFDNKKLSRLFRIWFLKHWRVTMEKDGQKKVENYKKIKEEWKKYGDEDNVIDFWLKIDPVFNYTSLPEYD